MKLERFNFSEKKMWKGFLYGFIVCAVLMVVVNLFTSKAKYRTTESIPLVRGKISYKMPDLNVIAMYQQNDSGKYESIDTIPSSGYALNTTESYCEVNKVKDTSITMEYANGLVNFNGINKKGTKCYLYFDKYVEPTMKNILSQRNIVAMPKITGVETADTTGTVYSVEDDLGTSYVFRGAPTDNWVSFGGFYWRIIRMNGDGSTRMIYAGESVETTGTDDQLASTSAFNSSRNDNAYVGYMYGSTGASSYANAHANTNNSTIKGALDTWYGTYLNNKTGVTEHINGNAGFCNDRTTTSGVHSSYGTLGYGTNATSYAPWGRLYSGTTFKTTQTPSLKCTNASNDLFTTSSSTNGNKKLTYPVGLITSDEVVYAGGFGNASSSGHWLYTGQNYWTMSPYSFYGSYASVFVVSSVGGLDGYLGYGWTVDSTIGVRPVINLKADTQFTGTGLASNPFQVADNLSEI